MNKFNLFGGDPVVSIQTMGNFPEDPKLEERRATARLRMKEEFKRPDLLSGGFYDRKENRILNRPVEGHSK